MNKHKDLTTAEWLLFIGLHNGILFFWMMVSHVKEAWRLTRKWAFVLMGRGSQKDFLMKDFKANMKTDGGDMAEDIFRANFHQHLLRTLGFGEEEAVILTIQVMPTQGVMYAFDRETANHVHRVGSFKTVGDALQLWYDYEEVHERPVRHFFGDQYDTVCALTSYTEAYKILQQRMTQRSAERHPSSTFNHPGAQYAAA